MLPLLLFLLIAPLCLSPLVLAQPPGGLTLESCRSDFGCTSPRTCVDTTTFRRCKSPSSASVCVCVPPSFSPCNSSSTCIPGEVCARALESPFTCISAAVLASPPSGPITAEQAAENPLIPECPSPNRSKSNKPPSRLIRMPDNPSLDSPPAIPPDAPPGAPPFFQPAGAPQFQPVPGSPAPPPPDLSDPKPGGLKLDICKPGTCATGLSCVTFKDASSAPFPLPDGVRSGGQSFRCCVDDDPVCLCHLTDDRPVCVSNADCNPTELCAETPIAPPTCTSREDIRKRTPAQQKLTIILRGKRAGKPGKRVPFLQTPTPSPDTAEESPEDAPEETEPPQVTDKPASDTPLPTVTPSPSAADTALSPSPEADSEASPEVEAQGIEGICVDAEALRHLDRSNLVFEHDRHARVLCDVDQSCATAGHMVRYKGKAMMMASYCDIAGCEEKVIKVNSPRYRRGMTVESRTEGLEYTSLAARYGTRVEEGALAGIIHMGL